MARKRVGFFRELPHGDPDGPSLHDARRESAAEDEAAILGYLARGAVHALSPGPVWDVLDESGPVGTASLLTDGEWVWPEDLAHYVEKYHVRLPAEFVARAKTAS